MQRLARPAAALLACLGLVLAASPKTPPGRHCPTAPVQTVVETRVDCCGNVVRVERSPKPGDSSFVQCRCAERKAREAVETGSAVPSVSLLAPPDRVWTLEGYLLAAPESGRPVQVERTRARPRAPSPPPPRDA